MASVSNLRSCSVVRTLWIGRHIRIRWDLEGFWITDKDNFRNYELLALSWVVDPNLKRNGRGIKLTAGPLCIELGWLKPHG